MLQNIGEKKVNLTQGIWFEEKCLVLQHTVGTWTFYECCHENKNSLTVQTFKQLANHAALCSDQTIEDHSQQNSRKLE